ncbi:MAG: 4Fe-4S dicluster domain-containing protein [Candidatus Bathyarchaeota archaeon]|nr:MAG: 4Fe-4S dicluster domain-containing protein [Candidatus Bathyarchaeota archaeon]
MQWGFYFDQTRCIGCHTCVIACNDWHDIEEASANWRIIKCVERGKFPNIFVAYLSNSCNHCSVPSCALACPVGAITKRSEDGIVVVNRETCLGRGDCKTLCKKACPYDAPRFAEDVDAKMQKCDLCLSRLKENKEPICVEACPMRALDAGPLDELERKHGKKRDAEGFAYSIKLKPSIIFKSK